MSDGYETEELVRIEAALDAMESPTSEDVFQATRPFDERAIASVAATRGGNSGSLPSQWTVGPGGEVAIEPDVDLSNDLYSLKLGTQNHSGAHPLEIFDRNGNKVWIVTANGEIDTVSGGTALEASGHIFVSTSDAAQPETLLVRANAAPSDIATGNAARFTGPGGDGARILGTGAFITSQHTAPPDAVLAAGDCAIWFDWTNGAAKLMVKAKTQDGTVVVGEVALT